MTTEEVIEIFDEDIESKWEGDNAFQGLQILSKYTNNLICGSEHDKIYGPDIEEVVEAGITKEEIIQLCVLNWMIEDGSYLTCFV